MAEHAVVVIHGIGEQRPGETVDHVVGSALAHFKETSTEVTSDVMQVCAPDVQGRKNEDYDLFPSHIRRITDKASKETLFAEVFWADLSPAPKGAFWTIFGLLRLVLGLGYLAMDNVENTRRTTTFGPVAFVHLFAWAFYGAIAAINAMILIGALLLIAAEFGFSLTEPEIPTSTVLLLNGGIAFAVGLVLSNIVAKTFLVRVFGRGMWVSGCVVIGIGILDALGVFEPTCSAVSGTGMGAFDCYLELAIFGLALAWCIAILLCLMMFCSAWWPSNRLDEHDGVTGHRQIYPAICAVMLILWMILSAAFWLLFQDIVTSLSTTIAQQSHDYHVHSEEGLLYGLLKDHLTKALNSLSATFFGLLVLVVAVGVVLLKRGLWKSRFRKEGSDQKSEARDDRIPRLIFNPILSRALFITLVLLAAVVGLLATGDGTCRMVPEDTIWRQGCDFLIKFNGVIAGVLLLLAVVIYNFYAVVAAGLGIVRDIVTYAVMKRCMWRNDAKDREENFIHRNRIEARCKSVLKRVLDGEDGLKRLTIISHSQGTVVATRVLRRSGPELFTDPNEPSVSLFTMGSPVGHIYRRYFPEHFPISSDLGLDAKRFSWVNIYRQDDFVGTRIEEDEDDPVKLKDECPVPPRGHTGYFVDRKVWEELAGAGFTIF